jgi:hypothetical protein
MKKKPTSPFDWMAYTTYKEMMDATAKDADRAYELLHRAETEMRYAGWNKYETDNTARNGVYEQIKEFLK